VTRTSAALVTLSTEPWGSGVLAGLEPLARGLMSVLGPAFEVECRAVVSHEPWYHESLPIADVIRLWAYTNVLRSDDPLWPFQPLRAAERKHLCEALGIDRSEVVGSSPGVLARKVIARCGLPLVDRAGPKSEHERWTAILEQVRAGEDEKGSVALRQQAERLLRVVLHFYASVQFGDVFHSIACNPGDIRVPDRLRKVVDRNSPAETVRLLAEDGWADLGFLALILRKVSSALETGNQRHLTGDALELLSAAECNAFLNLATALQSYTHDRPSKLPTRKMDLEVATVRCVQVVETMDRRRILPDELTVLEEGVSLIGQFYRGITPSGVIRVLSADKAPQVGTRILFVSSTLSEYAWTWWIDSPWPPSG